MEKLTDFVCHLDDTKDKKSGQSRTDGLRHDLHRVMEQRVSVVSTFTVAANDTIHRNLLHAAQHERIATSHYPLSWT